MENRNTQEIDDAVSLAGERVEKAITTLQQQVQQREGFVKRQVQEATWHGQYVTRHVPTAEATDKRPAASRLSSVA